MKILLVDDHAIVREGVRRLLATKPDVTVEEAEDGLKAIAMFKANRPDVCLVDLNLSGIAGLELIRRLLAEDKSARIIVFSMHAEPIYASRALRLGARGYVSKSAAAEELMAAVEKVASGGSYVERELASELAVGQYSGDDPLNTLTAREVDILRMLGDGKSLTEIANAMGVSYKTIANSCSLIKGKLGLERTADLIRISLQLLHN
ncbi:MAG: response regulator transcription factor [Hyphomicrobiaceae bacterium]